MPSFNSLYTVRSGLFAQRRALELVGQNIANASTVGYTRQEVSLSAAEPAHVINSTGRGIAEVNVVRYREEFLDRQYRGRNGALGYHSARSEQLQQVEDVLGDLSEGGLRGALNELFSAWDNLSLRPQETAPRVQIVQAAEEFLGQARTSFQELAQLRLNTDEAIRNKVAEINSAASQLAELNKAIVTGEVNQQQAHELRDRRDMLIDSLSRLAGASVTHHTDNTVSVFVGSLPIVDKEFSFPIDQDIQQEPDMATPPLTSTRQFLSVLTWNGTPNSVPFPAGEIAGLLEMRDQGIPAFMEYLDNMVRTVATEINTAHTSGVGAPMTPQNIFDIQAQWMNIQVDAAVKADPNVILAGIGTTVGGVFSVAEGDGERARAISGLRDQTILTGDPVGTRNVTPGEYLRTIFSVLGLQTQTAGQRADAAALQVNQADKYRQAVSGVSLDDEMTKMIQYQQAYNAAARVMTTIDEMLEIVISRVGLAGR